MTSLFVNKQQRRHFCPPRHGALSYSVLIYTYKVRLVLIGLNHLPLSGLSLLLNLVFLIVDLGLPLPLVQLSIKVLQRTLSHFLKAVFIDILSSIGRYDHFLLTLLAGFFFFRVFLSDLLITDPDVLVEIVLKAWV